MLVSISLQPEDENSNFFRNSVNLHKTTQLHKPEDSNFHCSGARTSSLTKSGLFRHLKFLEFIPLASETFRVKDPAGFSWQFSRENASYTRENMCTGILKSNTDISFKRIPYITNGKAEKVSSVLLYCAVRKGVPEVKDDSKLYAPPAPLGPYILLSNIRYWAGVLVEWLATHSFVLWSSGCNTDLKSVIPTEDFHGFLSDHSCKWTDSALNWATASIHTNKQNPWF